MAIMNVVAQCGIRVADASVLAYTIASDALLAAVAKLPVVAGEHLTVVLTVVRLTAARPCLA
jgi:hypothetical protein